MLKAVAVDVAKNCNFAASWGKTDVTFTSTLPYWEFQWSTKFKSTDLVVLYEEEEPSGLNPL